MKTANPLTLWAQCARIGVESQYVITLRTAAMMGMLPHRPGELSRMVSEKHDAAAESVRAAMRAAGRGARADEVLTAMLRPYGHRTRANAARLTRAPR